MHITFRIGLSLFLMACLPAAIYSEGTLWTDTFARVKHSIFPILVGDIDDDGALIVGRDLPIAGTGFFVGRGGYFITAGHVIDPIRQNDKEKGGVIIVPTFAWPVGQQTVEGMSFRFELVAVDEDNDLALCKVWTNPFENEPTKMFVNPILLDESVPADGTQVGFLGFPLHRRSPIAAQGIIGSFQFVEKGEQRGLLLLIHATSWPGSSGSPLFVNSGAVVGMVSGYGVEKTQGITSARPAKAIKALLRAHRVE